MQFIIFLILLISYFYSYLVISSDWVGFEPLWQAGIIVRFEHFDRRNRSSTDLLTAPILCSRIWLWWRLLGGGSGHYLRTWSRWSEGRSKCLAALPFATVAQGHNHGSETSNSYSLSFCGGTETVYLLCITTSGVWLKSYMA